MLVIQTAMPPRNRKELVAALVAYEIPIEPVAAALAQLPWDSAELVQIGREQVAAILDRYLRHDLRPDQVVDWANRIEGRDDIGFVPHDAELLKDVIFMLANPDINGVISQDLARRVRGKVLGLRQEAG